MERIFYSVNETVQVLGIGRTYTYVLINNGTLESRKVGRRRLVRIDSVRRFASGKD
ncbi:helix-turn-helix domain-containing protein [Erythrobacter sp. NFXS35]|uniref:helix-turn-helix domain-containing protein n=1 Tax=Erythrobacter sp. NFXS35 TaxID=2818436 RepID=UPI0032DFC2BA